MGGVGLGAGWDFGFGFGCGEWLPVRLWIGRDEKGVVLDGERLKEWFRCFVPEENVT